MVGALAVFGVLQLKGLEGMLRIKKEKSNRK
jgi:hypothetical protein